MIIVLTKRFVIFALVWLALSRGDPGGLAFGALAAGGAAWASLLLLPPGGRRLDLLAAVALIPGFVVSSVRGGVDVARRALHPAMPLDDGWIVYRTNLPAGLSRVSFGSEMSLLPGSLIAGGRGDLIYVHCLDRGQDIEACLRREEARIETALREDGAGRESG